MKQLVTTLIGKSVQKTARLRGGGSALPGLVVERLDPDYLRRTLSQLPRGVVLVSGTNGKTTTTKMVAELLRSQGLRVFTNPTGSNFTRGVVAALLKAADQRGRLRADIAVLELDEAYAVHFVRHVKPAYCLLLNVMRDQLDRFGEIDATAQLLHTVAKQTTKGVVVNADDPRLNNSTFLDTLTAPIASYGVSPQLLALFPSDDALRDTPLIQQALRPTGNHVELEAIDGQKVTFSFGGKLQEVELKLEGIYNMQNAAGALALTRIIMGSNLDEPPMLEALAQLTPAFGRGETVTIGKMTCRLILVKNPSGFRLSLKSFESKGHDTMIVINDNYADGRDMSWLWDVDFQSLSEGVAMVSGTRAYDMALRLQYDEIASKHVDTGIAPALKQFLTLSDRRPKNIYCTYTAMLAVRKELTKYTDVERAL